ncbi:MAG: aldehyde dehydrogenase family protein [Candidatus Aenigmarchaeota archaeon]|nr:aldehyde dehydrogenase family protein [Candidatus Aenigmarchaeota archaeon]
MQTYKMFVNGEWVESGSGETFEVFNPANGKAIAGVQKGTKEDAKSAIDAARHAFDKGPWRHTTPSERTEVLLKLADLVKEHSDALATLESMDVGKTLKYAKGNDLPFIIDNLRFFAGAARVLEGTASGEYVDFHSRRQHRGMGTSIIRREPVGVVGAIVPWNYPLYIAVWKIAPALAAGNTVVVKPASQTPLTVLEFAKLADMAGVPKGVLNVVTGPGEVVGTEMASSMKVDMIALTGDTATGKEIMRLASSNVKRVHLELGGKAPMVVLPDADLEAAAEGAVVGGFWNSGQDCTSVTRIYVHEPQRAKFVEMLAEKTRKFKVGDPMKDSTDMGPLISEKQRQRVEGYVRSGIDDGAQLVSGGVRPDGREFSDGYFFEPTVFDRVHHDMKISKEEIFGPVVCVSGYSTIEEAVDMANNTPYGLASSVWGSNIRDCFRIANELNFGTVWINEHGILASEMPHGGFRQSGFGKDLSIGSFNEFTRTKHVYVDLTGMRKKPWHSVVYDSK